MKNKTIVIHDYSGFSFTVQLSHELAKQGFDVHYIYAQFFHAPKGNVLRTPSDPDNFHSTAIDINKRYEKYNLFRRRSIERLYGCILSEKIISIQPDLVISANTPLDSKNIVINACRKDGINYILWLQDIYSIAIKKILHKKWTIVDSIIRMFYTKMEREVFKYCRHIMAITEDFITILRAWEIESGKIIVIPNLSLAHELGGW